MLVFTNKLLIELDAELRHIEQDQNTILKRSELSFNASKKIVAKLKEAILKYKFKTDEEQIKFFKEIKPLFTSRLIYNLMVYNIETKKPNGGKEILKNYLLKELEKLKHYFDYNLDFYKYHRAGATYLDHEYFLRDKQDIQLNLDAYIFENDPRFSTTHDFKVAKILAHDILQVHIEKELALLASKEPSNLTQVHPKLGLSWTDSKTSLIELIYALHAQGSFENGRADIKQLASHFEEIFNIELGEYYRTYLEIRGRKTGRSKFLDSLTERLLKRMDEADEK